MHSWQCVGFICYELEAASACSILERTATDGKHYKTQFYHIGAFLKDLGRKLFAFSRMTIPAQMVL